ncbi:hypothetical protein ACWCQS_30370 [Streptomyces sp. NPDC002076]
MPSRGEYSLTRRGALLNETPAPRGAWGRERVLGGEPEH